MRTDRRDFIKVAGLAVLVLGAKPSIDALAREESTASPSAAPAVKKRWAMVVDTAKCTDKACSDCIDACHRIHNVPAIPDPRREVKWLWREQYENAFPDQVDEHAPASLKGQSVLLLCNHCDNPPCVRVCPTQATWKRDADGIVMMDMHRCIGCRFCVAACPYGSRSFNWQDPRPFIQEINPEFPTRTKGVVEKCNFCEERLAKGLIPACVEACKEKALAFGDLEDPGSEVRRILESHYSIRRKPELGTKPQAYYIVS